MEEILHLEISGKFNGRDANLSIGLDAESAFEIEDLSSSTPEEEVDETPSPAEAQSVTEQTPTEPISTEEPEGTDAPPEPVGGGDEVEDTSEEDATGLDALFATERFDEEDIPPFSAGTKQFLVVQELFESEDTPVRVRTLTDRLQDKHGEDEWNDSRVTSHLYSVLDKEIIDREKDDASGKYQYYVTELGEAALKYAQTKSEEEEEDADAAAA